MCEAIYDLPWSKMPPHLWTCEPRKQGACFQNTVTRQGYVSSYRHFYSKREKWKEKHYPPAISNLLVGHIPLGFKA